MLSAIVPQQNSAVCDVLFATDKAKSGAAGAQWDYETWETRGSPPVAMQVARSDSDDYKTFRSAPQSGAESWFQSGCLRQSPSRVHDVHARAARAVGESGSRPRERGGVDGPRGRDRGRRLPRPGESAAAGAAVLGVGTRLDGGRRYRTGATDEPLVIRGAPAHLGTSAQRRCTVGVPGGH